MQPEPQKCEIIKKGHHKNLVYFPVQSFRGVLVNIPNGPDSHSDNFCEIPGTKRDTGKNDKDQASFLLILF